jgi:hypothetical protein
MSARESLIAAVVVVLRMAGRQAKHVLWRGGGGAASDRFVLGHLWDAREGGQGPSLVPAHVSWFALWKQANKAAWQAVWWWSRRRRERKRLLYLDFLGIAVRVRFLRVSAPTARAYEQMMKQFGQIGKER